MRQGTTPTHIFTLPIDMSKVSEVKVTYTQRNRIVLEKRTDQVVIDGADIRVKLSQEETFMFDASPSASVQIQIRVLTTGGDALASDIMTVSALKCLDSEVMG